MIKALNFAFSAKKIIIGNQCIQIISETAQQISRVAGLTLGPMGRNVVIENEKGLPRITKDGVTVVKHIEYVVDKTRRRTD
jgi:chaperonin GroEL